MDLTEFSWFFFQVYLSLCHGLALGGNEALHSHFVTPFCAEGWKKRICKVKVQKVMSQARQFNK